MTPSKEKPVITQIDEATDEIRNAMKERVKLEKVARDNKIALDKNYHRVRAARAVLRGLDLEW